MARKYQLKRRAERQEDTRRRIVEAAVALHTTLGPAHTSVSAIAAKAGIQRHTFYRHFPEERSLGMACSGLFHERHPPPEPDAWLGIEDADERLERGIGEFYDYFERKGAALWPIVRDAEGDDETRAILAIRFGPIMERTVEVLADPYGPSSDERRRVASLLSILLDFAVWRRLRSSVGGAAETVELAVLAVQGVLGDRCARRASVAAVVSPD